MVMLDPIGTAASLKLLSHRPYDELVTPFLGTPGYEARPGSSVSRTRPVSPGLRMPACTAAAPMDESDVKIPSPQIDPLSDPVTTSTSGRSPPPNGRGSS